MNIIEWKEGLIWRWNMIAVPFAVPSLLTSFLLAYIRCNLITNFDIMYNIIWGFARCLLSSTWDSLIFQKRDVKSKIFTSWKLFTHHFLVFTLPRTKLMDGKTSYHPILWYTTPLINTILLPTYLMTWTYSLDRHSSQFKSIPDSVDLKLHMWVEYGLAFFMNESLNPRIYKVSTDYKT